MNNKVTKLTKWYFKQLFENPRDRISFEINTRESFNYNLKRGGGKKKDESTDWLINSVKNSVKSDIEWETIGVVQWACIHLLTKFDSPWIQPFPFSLTWSKRPQICAIRRSNNTNPSRADALLKFTGKNRGKERTETVQKLEKRLSILAQNYLRSPPLTNFEFVLDTFTMGWLDSLTRERSQMGGKVGQMGDKGGGSLRE